MPILTVDPFRLLNLPRSADPEMIEEAYTRHMKSAGDEERREIARVCALLRHPDGLRIARLATPVCGRAFSELTEALPARPRYLGPGSWKKVLRRLLSEERSHGGQ